MLLSPKEAKLILDYIRGDWDRAKLGVLVTRLEGLVERNPDQVYDEEAIDQADGFVE